MTTDWTTRRVALVCGGDSSEREVSLRTGAAFAEALRSVGVAPTVVDLRRGTLPDLIAARPDVVLIALHGRHGEDGALQGALELLGIPYTGSGVAASALAMDKVRSKCVFERFGVETPRWTIVAPASECPPAPMDAPFVVKPALEGSSVGVTIVTDVAQWPDAWAAARGCRGDLLVEEFIAGRELTVGVFDGQPMGIVEIAPADGFYDYDA
ncbi:MAG: D-alanine--D-alanine ligase, partial [Myxococcales bacterium]|nr:D-alanine--D-alanine ligase [Myxococcales bacterium]